MQPAYFAACNSDNWSVQDQTGHEPRKRMRRLFESLYACLVRGGRAVLQIYPENAQQVDTDLRQVQIDTTPHSAASELGCLYCQFVQAEMLTSTAMKAGFSGGLVVDFPHSTRAKKYFLVLMVGSSSYQPQAKGIGGEGSESDDQQVQVANRQRSNKRRKTSEGNIQVKPHPNCRAYASMAHFAFASGKFHALSLLACF